MNEQFPTQTTEVLDTAGVVDRIYEHHGLDSLLQQFAAHKIGEADVEPALKRFSYEIGDFALDKAGGVDIEMVSEAFNRLANGYSDAHASLKPQPTGWQKAIAKVRRSRPEYKPRFKNMDERYWDKQFMEEYATLANSDPEQFPDYVWHCVRGFSWAPFTLGT